MTDTHCPGFESNKALSSCDLKCPECGEKWEVFSDEMEKPAKCPSCGISVEPKDNCVK